MTSPFDEYAAIEHRNLVRDLTYHIHFVSDHDDGDSGIRVHPLEKAQNVIGRLWVQR